MGATLTLCGNKLIMFGGFCKSSLDDLNTIDLKTAKWTPIHMSGKKPEERYGHTACFYVGKLFIFGGESKFNP